MFKFGKGCLYLLDDLRHLCGLLGIEVGVLNKTHLDEVTHTAECIICCGEVDLYCTLRCCIAVTVIAGEVLKKFVVVLLVAELFKLRNVVMLGSIAPSEVLIGCRLCISEPAQSLIEVEVTAFQLRAVCEPCVLLLGVVYILINISHYCYKVVERTLVIGDDHTDVGVTDELEYMGIGYADSNRTAVAVIAVCVLYCHRKLIAFLRCESVLPVVFLAYDVIALADELFTATIYG